MIKKKKNCHKERNETLKTVKIKFYLICIVFEDKKNFTIPVSGTPFSH